MTWTKLTCAVSLAILPALAVAAHADALSIKVKLWQHGDRGGIDLSQEHMKAGPVEFVVTNTSVDPLEGKMHELLVVPLAAPATKLPYDAAKAMVRESELPIFEGLEDMLPSATATLRLVLKPGQYLLLSNQLPHDYESGMAHRFVVDP